MKNEIVYCSYSETIRQMPQNYMIASKKNTEWGEQSSWYIDPDLAADPKIVCAVTLQWWNMKISIAKFQRLQ